MRAWRQELLRAAKRRDMRLLVAAAVGIVLARALGDVVGSARPVGARAAFEAATMTLADVTACLGLLVPALLTASDAELGLMKERCLAGTTLLRATGQHGVTGAAATLTVAVGGALVAAAVGGLDALVRGTGKVIAFPYRLSFAAAAGRFIVLAVAVAVLGAVVGSPVGVALRSRVVAAATMVGLGAGGLLLRHAATVWPALRTPALLEPVGLLAAVIRGRDDFLVRTTAAGPRLVALGLMAWSAAAAIAWRVEVRAVVRGRVPSASSRRALRGRWFGGALAVGVMLALAVGYVVPTMFRDEVPWRLRPQWLVDQATGRASDDVTETFLADVRRGRLDAAARLTSRGDATETMATFRPLLVGADPDRIRVFEAENASPGTVTAYFPGGQAVTACLTRRPEGWRIDGFVSTGRCE